MKPKEVIELAKKNDVKFVDLKFIDFPGIWQHTTDPGRAPQRGRSSRTASASTARRSAAGSRSTRRDMMMIPDARQREARPVLRTPHAERHLLGPAIPITKQPYSRDPRHIAKKAESVPPADRHRRHVVLRPRSRVLRLRSTSATINSQRERGLLLPRHRRRRTGTPAARRARTSATRRATRKATSPSRRPTRSPNLRMEMMLDARGDAASRSRSATTRSRPAGSARSA